MSIELKCSDIPEFLKKSEFYKNLELQDDDESFSIPNKYFLPKVDIKSIGDLEDLFHVLRYWMVNELPYNEIFNFVENNCHLDYDFDPLVKEFSNMDVIKDIGLIQQAKKKLLSKQDIGEVYNKNPLLTLAIAYGSIGLLKWVLSKDELKEQFNTKIFTNQVLINAIDISIVHSNFTIFEFLLDNKFFITRESLIYAVENKDIRFLKTFGDRNFTIDNSFLAYNAISKDNLENLKYLYDIGCPLEEDCADSAFRNGKFACFQYCIEKGYVLSEVGFWQGHQHITLEVFKDIIEKKLFSSEVYKGFNDRIFYNIDLSQNKSMRFKVCNYIINEKLEYSNFYLFVACLKDKEISKNFLDKVIFDEELMINIIVKRLNKILSKSSCKRSHKIAHKLGCPLTEDIIICTVLHEQYDILKFLIEENCPRDDKRIINAVILHGNYKMFVFLSENGISWHKRTLKQIFKNDKMEFLRYVLKRDIEYDFNLCEAAVKFDAIRCFKFLVWENKSTIGDSLNHPNITDEHINYYNKCLDRRLKSKLPD